MAAAESPVVALKGHTRAPAKTVNNPPPASARRPKNVSGIELLAVQVLLDALDSTTTCTSYSCVFRCAEAVDHG